MKTKILMNLKKTIREALLKKQKRVYEYGCVMVGLNTITKEWNKIQNLIDEDDIYFGDGKEGGYGRELDPHITILFGIHDNVEDKDVELLINDINKPELTLNNVSLFENELFDVLKFDIESLDLHELNKKFKSLPHTTDFPNYHPHTTICYCKKSQAQKYIKTLNDYIKNIDLDVTVKNILYSKPDGTKKTYKIK